MSHFWEDNNIIIIITFIGGIVINTDLLRNKNSISESEYNQLHKVLKCYDIDVIDISKIRSAYKVNSKQGAKCLKRIKHGRRKADKVYYLTQYLISRGFKNVARYNKTINGKAYVKQNGSYYYMLDWISGEECDLNDLYKLKKSVEVLANFHMAASGSEGRNYFKVKSNLKNWPGIYLKHCNDLVRYSRLIERKKIKSEFDIKYKNNIDNFYRQGLIAVDILNKSNYYDLCKKARDERTICHDSFYYQNLIIDDVGNIYIIDLDSTVQDIVVYDLGKLIRRIMYKEGYKWNFEIVKEIIDTYNSILHLSSEELEVMLAIIIFPHKFWKLGRRRYDKHKFWSEEKYMKKLNKVIKYLNVQQEFLRKFIGFYSIDVDLDKYMF